MDTQLPLRLYQANAELQLRIAQLLQDGARTWLCAAQRLGAAIAPELKSQIDSLLRTTDWQEAGDLPQHLLWHLLDNRLADAHDLQEVAFRSQLTLAIGLQQAWVEWQKNVLGAVADDASRAAAARHPHARNGAAASARAANE